MNGASPRTAVLLPGTGSDDVFVLQVFAAPLAVLDIRTVAPVPDPGPNLARAHLAALDDAASREPILAGGVSFGAHLAAEWALANPSRCAGLLIALPGWHGEPDGAPAAVAATYSAAQVSTLGLAGALRAATEDVPCWLADELTRAWTRYGDGLAESLELAANHPAPTVAELATLPMPAGIAGCTDDPIHPVAAAESWATAIPGAALRTTTLAALGAARTSLGEAVVSAWLAALGDREGAA